MEKSSVSLKLLIDRRGKRVLFAEAGKDVVDFLFHLLSLPVATIVRLLRHQGIKGSLPKLYNSLENLDTTYIETGKNKDTFLKPVSHSSVMLLGICHNAPTPNKSSYNCTDASSDGGYFCSSPRYRLPSYDDDSYMCNTSVELEEESSGLVKGVVTYMVMDDLEVKPMSTISSLTLFDQNATGYLPAGLLQLAQPRQPLDRNLWFPARILLQQHSAQSSFVSYTGCTVCR